MLAWATKVALGWFLLLFMLRAELSVPPVEPAPVAAVSPKPAVRLTAAPDDPPLLYQVLQRLFAASWSHCQTEIIEIERGTYGVSLGLIDAPPAAPRIVPHMRDGQAAGFKLFDIRPGSLYAQLGVRNGDIIRSVNGLDLSSPEKALEIWPKLTSTRHFEVEMERDGEPLTLIYRLRPPHGDSAIRCAGRS